ncbi:MAG: hypothetical protein CVV24_01805 [Ignavibacteriae bacterium HGW-Ignavibacteriae-3]|nr:MAG: hypothetical protein CVV24_01805 [Ignavibacteriae bacterium HGW-Ignavibacteriae-3]
MQKVLIVEDDALTSDVIVLFLKGKYIADTAKSAEEAVEFIAKNKYLFILMDINLGKGKSGLELAKDIRIYSGYDKVPIIASSAFIMINDKKEFIDAGFNDFLNKPYTREELFKVINRNIQC